MAPPSRSRGGPDSPAAAIFLDQVHARQRHVQLRVAGVFEQHEVALLLALHDFAEAQKLPDAVGGVDHEVAGLEIGQVGREAAKLALGDARPRDQIRRIEQIFGADERDVTNPGKSRRAGPAP